MDGVDYYTDERRHVCVVDIDGGEPRQLTFGDYNHLDVSWTPNGRGLLFAAAKRGPGLVSGARRSVVPSPGQQRVQRTRGDDDAQFGLRTRAPHPG